MILIPLRPRCKNGSDVIELIERIFADIRSEKPLEEFYIAKQTKASGQIGMYSYSIILKPTLWGMGVDLKELMKSWRSNRKTPSNRTSRTR